MSKKQTPEPALYYAFVDGSCHERFQNKKICGVGGLIIEEKNGKKQEFFFSEQLKKKNTSLTAELRAATIALNRIPARSCVVLHSDFKIRTEKIGANALKVWGEKTKKSGKLQQAYTDLFNAVARHEQVTAIHVRESHGTLGHYIQAAHKLANAGAKGCAEAVHKDMTSQRQTDIPAAPPKPKRHNRRQKNLTAIVESLGEFGLELADVL